jgi:hypothetical protein
VCVWGGGGYGVLGLRQIKNLPQSPVTGQFFRCRHFALPFLKVVSSRYTNILDAKAFEREDQGSEFEALVTARFVHLLFLLAGFCPSMYFKTLFQS